jgi:ankyrin repeat protein
MDALLSLPTIDLNSRNNDSKPKGQAPLCAAIAAQELVFVQKIVRDPRCRLDLPNESGQTPLWLAVSGESRQFVDELITAGANVNMANADGGTHLMRALELCNAEAPRQGIAGLVERLVSAGADPNLWYTGGRLPVHIAAEPVAQVVPAAKTRVPPFDA